MDQLDLLFTVVQTPGFAGLRYLVADGIEDNTGMVIVLGNHLGGVFRPVGFEIQTVVELVLAIVPHIEGLVHHVHAVMVAGLQHGTAAGIVGGADGIEARFLQDPDSAPFAFIIGGSAQDAVVMVDTAAPEEGLLAVDEEAPGAPFDFADAKLLLRHVIAHRDPAGIEVGGFIAPESGVGNGDFAGNTGSDDCIALQNLHLCISGGVNFHLDHSRVYGEGGDLHAPIFNPLRITNVEPHGAVDTGTGIPPGIGNLRIIGNHGKGILFAAVQFQRQRKAGVSVAVSTDFFAVQGDGAVSVDTFKFNQNLPACPFAGYNEGFFIGIHSAGEITVTAIGGGSGTKFGNLGVMGKGYGLAVADPTVVERDLFHCYRSFLKRAAAKCRRPKWIA